MAHHRWVKSRGMTLEITLRHCSILRREPATAVCAVDSGSFSGIAKQPSFGKLAVVKAVAKFEDRPVVRLLMRSAHCPETTAAGPTFAFGAFRLFPPERWLPSRVPFKPTIS
jgi:hypothetical protein